MATELALVIKAIGTGRKLVPVLREIDRPGWVAERLRASAEQVNQDMIQMTFAVCREFVAQALGRDPSSEDVDAFIASAAGDPTFPARAHRLLGELKKASSGRRRRFLASALYGLQFSKLPDDERDRVDMAIERMMPGDVELLVRIDEGRKRPPRKPIPEVPVGPSNVFALISGSEFRLSVTDHWQGDGLTEEFLHDETSRADLVALAALQSLGCVRLGERHSTIDFSSAVDLGTDAATWIEHPVMITAVGELVIRAIEEMRPGLEAE